MLSNPGRFCDRCVLVGSRDLSGVRGDPAIGILGEGSRPTPVLPSVTRPSAFLSPLMTGSGCGLRAAEPFVETDAAEARLAKRHERALLDPAAPVSGLGVAHD